MPADRFERDLIQIKLGAGAVVVVESYHPPLPPIPIPQPEPAASPVPQEAAEPTAIPPPILPPIVPVAEQLVDPAQLPAIPRHSYCIAVIEAAPCRSEELTAALAAAAHEQGPTALHIIHLGCRWAPRLFQPILTRADAIWLIAPPNRWTAVEMRLDQAEFSGWTDLDKVAIITLGQGAPPPPDIAHLVAAELRDPHGPDGQAFYTRILGRVKR